MPRELTDAHVAHLVNEALPARLTPAQDRFQNARQLNEMLAFMKLVDGVELSPQELYARVCDRVDEEIRKRLDAALPLLTERELELGERRERRALRKEKRFALQARVRREIRRQRGFIARGLAARDATVPPPRTHGASRHGRAPRGNVRTTPRCARAPGSQSEGDPEPVDPAVAREIAREAGFWHISEGIEDELRRLRGAE